MGILTICCDVMEQPFNTSRDGGWGCGRDNLVETGICFEPKRGLNFYETLKGC